MAPFQVLKGASGTTHKVMVASPHYQGAPKAVAVFFPGDQLQMKGLQEEIQRLQDPRQQAAIMQQKFPDCHAAVVLPSRLEACYACFDHWLSKTTLSGEPLGYPVRPLRALKQLQSLLDDAQLAPGGGHSWPVHLIGFSKGGVVLNQVLAELSQPCNEPEVVCLRQSLREIHFCDVGLNSRGVFLTDPRDLQNLAQEMKQSLPHLSIMLHGTPRQWADSTRPWIAAEKKRFIKGLADAGIRIAERTYFEGQDPSLLMHFQCIEAMQRQANAQQ